VPNCQKVDQDTQRSNGAQAVEKPQVMAIARRFAVTLAQLERNGAGGTIPPKSNACRSRANSLQIVSGSTLLQA